MATATWTCCSFDDDLVTVAVDYDTTTFVVQDIRYQNLTSQNAAVAITIAVLHQTFTHTLAANTQPTTLDVSADNVTLTHTVSTDRKTNTTVTVVGWPSGVSVSFQWPA